MAPSDLVVGLGGLEPPASPLSGVRSNHLSYRPGNLISGQRRKRNTSRSNGATKRDLSEECRHGWRLLDFRSPRHGCRVKRNAGVLCGRLAGKKDVVLERR